VVASASLKNYLQTLERVTKDAFAFKDNLLLSVMKTSSLRS
jgi:hypothetical protein